MSRRASGALSAVVLLLAAAAALAAPWIAPYDPTAVVAASLAPPSVDHPFGTDRLGRDLLSRVLHGARLSLGGAGLALAGIMLVGLTLGAVAGLYGRLIDAVIMRSVDAVLAVPTLVLAMAIAGMLPPGLLTVVLALTAVWWARYARVTRALVLTWRERQFVEAARALGAGNAHILRRHLLPHILAPLLALSAVEFGTLILGVSALSFLGLGAQPPTAEWGAMISDAKAIFLVAPHALLVPALTVTTVVLAFNVVGEQIGEWLGPRRSALARDATLSNLAARSEHA